MKTCPFSEGSLSQRMWNFVIARDGAVRFDDYMQEHLFGVGGFYRDRVRIEEGGHFTTPSQKPAFAHLLGLSLEERHLLGLDFVEEGGGNGAFKRNFLSRFSPRSYISVDPSPSLLLQQSLRGTANLLKSAESTSLRTASIQGTIFSYEMLDALACRVFEVEVTKTRAVIKREGFVVANEDGFGFEFRATQRDEFVELYEHFLREKRRGVSDGNIFSVSEKFRPVLQECDRILARGVVLFFDYGYFEDGAPAFQRCDFERPYFVRANQRAGIGEILERPYETDITYKIDFDFLIWLCDRLGLKSHQVQYQHSFFAELMLRQGMIYNGIPDPARFSPDYLEMTAPRDFTVLILEK